MDRIITSKLNKDKREIFLRKILDIEPVIENYIKNIDSKFKRSLIVKEKAIVKVISLLLKNIFSIDIKCKIKTFFGRKMEIYIADQDASALFFFGTLYGEELKIIKFIIKNLKENEVFYDIGANYGFYTVLCQELIDPYKGEIHSFEPLFKIFNLLKRNALLKQYQNTYLNNIALSDKIGFFRFFR